MNFTRFISGVSAFAVAASAFAGMAVTANAAVGDPNITGSYADGIFSWTIDGAADDTGFTAQDTHTYTATATNQSNGDNVELTVVPGGRNNNYNNKYDGILDGNILFVRSSDAGTISDRYIKVTPSVDGYFVFDLTGTRVYGSRNDYNSYIYANDVTDAEGPGYTVTTDNLIFNAATYKGSFTKTNASYEMQAGHTYVISMLGGNAVNNTVKFSNLRYSPMINVNAVVAGVGTIKTYKAPLTDKKIYYEKYIEYNGKYYETSENAQEPRFAATFDTAGSKDITYTEAAVDYAVEGENIPGVDPEFSNIRDRLAGGNAGRISSNSKIATIDWTPDVDSEVTLVVTAAERSNDEGGSTTISVYLVDGEGNRTDTGKQLSWGRSAHSAQTETITVSAGSKIALFFNATYRSNLFVDYVSLTATSLAPPVTTTSKAFAFDTITASNDIKTVKVTVDETTKSGTIDLSNISGDLKLAIVINDIPDDAKSVTAVIE